MTTPEDKARDDINELLEKAGWKVQDYKSANLHAGRGVALRNFPLAEGHGFADYLLYVDGKAAGVIEAKKTGVTLTGVEVQAAKYSEDCLSSYRPTSAPFRFSIKAPGSKRGSRTASIRNPAAAGPSPFTDRRR